MGRSFFIGNETQLSSGSTNFTTRIVADPEQFGLSAEDAEAYAALNDTFQAAYLASSDRFLRNGVGVAAKNNAAAALRAAASSLASVINGNSSVTDSQRIELGLSVRAKRSPIPSPGKPSALKVELGGLGSLALSWACKNPKGSSGTIYQLHRRIGHDGEFTFLAQCGTRFYEDTTVPAGAAEVTYRIQAIRSTAVGLIAEFPVSLGVSKANMQLLARTMKQAA